MFRRLKMNFYCRFAHRWYESPVVPGGFSRIVCSACKNAPWDYSPFAGR